MELGSEGDWQMTPPERSRDRPKRRRQVQLAYGIRPWTPEEERRLRPLITERLRPHEVAVKLHRTTAAVRRRVHILGLSFKAGLKTKPK